MHCRLSRLAEVAALLATALAAVPATVVTADAVTAAGRSAPVVPAASLALPGSRTVLLINGDSVRVPRGGPGRGPGVVTTTGSGLAGSVLQLSLSGKSYEIPAAALPYLGRGLDPSLFNVPLLAGRETGGRLPVEVAYRGGRPSLPGVTITTAAAGIAHGYLTAASAHMFGAALVRQFLADHPRGSYGQDGLFGGGVTVWLAGITGPAVGLGRPARAGYALHTLTVTGTNLAGKADTGDPVVVFNADNTALFGDGFENVNFFYRGTAKFSVPAGHYWALGDFVDVSPKGRPAAERVVVLPQFTVSGNRHVRVAERAANSRIAMTTPRPSSVTATGFELRRVPRAGFTVSLYWLENGAFPLWVSPTTRRPTVGKLQDYTGQWHASPATAAKPYEYNLAYGASGIIPPQGRVVTQRSLATIRARYYCDLRSRGDVVTLGLFHPQASDELFGPAYLVGMPRIQTQYVTGNPAITWWEGVSQYATIVAGIPGPSGGQWAGPKVYHAGERVNENWDAYPLHPGMGRSGGLTEGLSPGVVPSASRSGNILRLNVTPFSDSNGHTGEGFVNADSPVTGSYQIGENGKKIAGGKAVTGPGRPAPRWAIVHFWQVKVGSKPSLITFTVDAARIRARYPLSTKTQTVWAWRSADQAGGQLPIGWVCSPGQAERHCTVEPMMTLRYQVARLALNETVPPGKQVLDVTAGHLQLAKAAPVTTTTVQVSFDNGKTWRGAVVTSLGGGHYRAVYTAPAGRYVTLRVSASDAAHGQITETITRAYQTASH